MAKYEPPVTTSGPRGGTLRPPTPGGRPKPPAPSRPKPPPPGAQPTLTPPSPIVVRAEKKKKADEELTWSDVTSAIKKTPGVMGQMTLAAPGAMLGLGAGLAQGPMEVDEDSSAIKRAANALLPFIGISKTAVELGKGIINTVQGDNIKLAAQALKAGESPLPYVLEDVGNIAIVAGGTGLAFKGAAAGAKSTAVKAAAETGARQAFRVARAADNISDAPITLPAYGIGKGVNLGGRMGRSHANNLRAKAAKAEAENPLDSKVQTLRSAADKFDDFFGKEVFVNGVARTITRKAQNRFTNRAMRRTNSVVDALSRTLPKIVNEPLYRDDINPATGEAYGPLSPVEQQAVIATLNGRARLINEVAARLGKTPGEVALLGRYDYAPMSGLTPEGAQLAVDFLNMNVDDVTGQRLANATERLSRELEANSELARAGYGRQNALAPMYDIPLPEPQRFAARLRETGATDALILADELDELLAQGYFDELLAGDFQSPNAQDALNLLQTYLERSPVRVALDPSIYPAKERNNIAFYGRIREALRAQAAATAGGTPPGPGYPGGRPTPMDEGAAVGIPPEDFYDSINAPGAFSRMPERYLRNSIKQLERLRGRARQIGEKIVQIELSIRNLEFKVIKATLRIESLEGYYTDADGNRVLPDEDGTYPADATFNPGLIARLIAKRDAAAAELARMRAEQAQTTVIDGKVHTVEQVEQMVVEADEGVAAVEAAIEELEAEVDATTSQMDEMEKAQADAANSLEDMGEDADVIVAAATADADSIPGDPEAFLTPDDGTAALESARADVDAARTAREAARIAELEARGKIVDLETRYREQEAEAQAAMAEQEGQPATSGFTPDNIIAAIEDAVDAEQISKAQAARLKAALDLTFELPKGRDAAKANAAAINDSYQTTLFVFSLYGKRYFSDSYVVGEIDSASPLNAAFRQDGVYVSPWGEFGVAQTKTNAQGNKFITADINGDTYTIERIQTGLNKKGQPAYEYKLAGPNVSWKSTFKTVTQAKDAAPKAVTEQQLPNLQNIVQSAVEQTRTDPAEFAGVAPVDGDRVIIFTYPDGVTARYSESNLAKVMADGDTLHFDQPIRPALIKRNGEFRGVVMPLRSEATPMSMADVIDKMVNDPNSTVALPAEVLARLPQAPKLATPKAPRKRITPSITPDDLDAATAEWNNTQDAVRAADEALLAAQNQLRAVENAVPAARLAPPAATTVEFGEADTARQASAAALDRHFEVMKIQDALEERKAALQEAGAPQAEIDVVNAELIAAREAGYKTGDAYIGATNAEYAIQRALPPAVRAEYLRQRIAEAEQWLATEGQKPDTYWRLRSNYQSSLPTYQRDLAAVEAQISQKTQAAEAAPAADAEARLAPPSRMGVEMGDLYEITTRGTSRLRRSLDAVRSAERDLQSATLRRRELRKAGATAEELTAAEDRVVRNRARVDEAKKQRVAVRAEMIAEAVAAMDMSFFTSFEVSRVETDDPFGSGYYEGDLQIKLEERRGLIAGLDEYVDKIEDAIKEYNKVVASGANPTGARASQLRRRIEEARGLLDKQIRDIATVNSSIGYDLAKLGDLEGLSRSDAAAAFRNNMDARLAAPPPPDVISTSAATEADWQKQSDGTFTINTGSRRYAALKVDITPPGAKKKRTTWALKRYGSDGEIIEGATQVFPNFKAARDYVQKQIEADGLDTGQRYIYRPGRELGAGPGTEVPVELLAAEQRLERAESAVGSAQQRLQNLRTQIEKNSARIDKLRVNEAAQRAKLAPITGAAIRTEARLAPEIYTQPEMRLLAGQTRGAPMVGQALTETGAPVLPGEDLPAMLRPTEFTRRVVDDQIREVNAEEASRGVPVEQRSREVEIVEKAANEALLRMRQSLPPALPGRVALSVPQEVGDTFIGSQYVPAGRRPGRSAGGRRTIEQGLTGERGLRSERRRTGEAEEIYDILELSRVLIAERRQMELNEAYRALLNSQLALSPEELLGEDTIAAFETEAYERAWRGTDGGWAAYAPGVRNRDAVFERSRREILGSLIDEEMAKRGFATLPRQGDILSPVPDIDIDGTTKYIPTYAKERISQKTRPPANLFVQLYLGSTGRLTGAFKNLTLPLSIMWQIGDLVGIIWAAAVTGVPPSKMADYMAQMLVENYGGGLDAPRKRDIVRNIFKDPQDRVVGKTADLLAASGIQDTGLRIEESRVLRGQDPGAEPQTIPQRLLTRFTPDLPRPTLQGGRLGVTRGNVGNLFPSLRKRAYRVNEAINRVGRHAYFLAKLGDELNKLNAAQGTNYTIDDIAELRLHERPGPIREAWEDAIDTANEVMGDWLDLTPFERRVVLPHLTFYAWTKHIHKLFIKVAKDNPSAIKWQMYLGALAYDPDSDPLEMYSSYVPTPGGGLAGTNFLNSFGDVVEGPLGSFALQSDPSRLFSGTSPMPRILYGALLGENLAKGLRPISRQYGTGEVTKTGQQKNVPLIKRPGELLGFAAQQFPLGTKLLDLLPSGQIPGTSIQTGPFERYDTGQARFKPMTSRPVPKFGGRLLTAARLVALPGVPTTSIEKMRDIERRAQQRLRAFETAKKTAEARND